MKRLLALALCCCGGTGCQGPAEEPWRPLIICHNANCVEPADPAEDDTLEALDASLALRDAEGRPLIDGVEIDTFWDGDTGQCLFAHDLEGAGPRVEAIEAAWRIRRFLNEEPGQPFHVFVELKGHVGPSKAQRHTASQREAHARCALEVAAELGEAEGESSVVVVFTSFEPTLLAEVARLRREEQVVLEVPVAYGALQGIPAPLDSQTQPLDAFGPQLDLVSAHPHWLRHGGLRAVSARGLGLGLWMFSMVPETLDAIERYEPEYITTSEARALSGWLENRW